MDRDDLLYQHAYSESIDAHHPMYGSVLHAGVRLGDSPCVRWQLERGADVDALGSINDPRTPLALAIEEGSIEIVELLLNHGAGINNDLFRELPPWHTWSPRTVLSLAASCATKEIVKLLLNRGADINAIGSEYGTALGVAVYKERNEIVTLLLDQGADINTIGGKYGTPLGVAAHGAHARIATLLLDRGADINTIGGEYGTALGVAAHGAHARIVRLLLDRGADIKVIGGDYGTALGAAAAGGMPQGLARTELLIKEFLRKGADINAIGGKYGTALGGAAYMACEPVVKLLLDLGADINVIGGKYGTILRAAAHGGSTEIVRSLLLRGADVNGDGVTSRYGTALDAAVSGGNKKTVEYLLDQGVEINALNSSVKYFTVLGTAVYEGKEDIVEVLLERGADINLVVDRYGTLLGGAVYRQQWGIVDLLLKHGSDATSVGGFYETTSGAFPNALDAALHSNSSSEQRALLVSAMHKHTKSKDVISLWPPFPMPDIESRSSRTCSHQQPRTPATFDALEIFTTALVAGQPIRPDQADVPCKELKEETLIQLLVSVVGLNTKTTRRAVINSWVRRDVRYFVKQNFDFGLAYALSRVAWRQFNDESLSDDDISVQRGRWHRFARQLHEARTKAIHKEVSGQELELIKSPYSVMPRRIWDLKSNRVLDFLMLHSHVQSLATSTELSSTLHPIFWAVTHSWTSDMKPVMTSINQYQWPVPCPKGISLDRNEYANVRSELLSLGAEYIWLDVLCLRQQSAGDGSTDQEILLKHNEWKLDVPTIGNIYRAAERLVRYFNGLGKTFSLEDWDSPQHWLKRAWTLQEISSENKTFNGGIVQDSGSVILNSRCQNQKSGTVTTLRRAMRPVLRLAAQVNSSGGCGVYDLAREMARRHATQSVDKLAGLFYLLRTSQLPCYHSGMTDEQVWLKSFHLISFARKIEVLFDFPYRGLEKQWFPTWEQMMGWPEREPDCEHSPAELPNIHPLPQLIHATEEDKAGLFLPNIWSVSQVRVKSTSDPSEYEVRIGKVVVVGFYTPYVNQKPIELKAYEEQDFTLATLKLENSYNWMVCETLPKQRGQCRFESEIKNIELTVLKKVGVLRTDSCNELLVRGENGGSLLSKVDCLFV